MNFFKQYSSQIKIFGVVAVATTLFVSGYFIYKSTKPKPANSPAKTTTQTNTSKVTTPAKVNFDGKYSGETAVASGISSATAIVNGSALSGNAFYVGPFGVKIPIQITGSVQRGDTTARKDSNIQCSFSGTGSALGQSIKVNGACSGHIINTSMNVSYSGTATGAGQSQTYPGQITLSKR